MRSNEHTFCRKYLAEVMKEVREKVSSDIIKNAWGYKYDGMKNIEFHINICKELPNGFFWSGKGCCVWDAKANGWSTFMENKK